MAGPLVDAPIPASEKTGPKLSPEAIREAGSNLIKKVLDAYGLGHPFKFSVEYDPGHSLEVERSPERLYLKTDWLESDGTPNRAVFFSDYRVDYRTRNRMLEAQLSVMHSEIDPERSATDSAEAVTEFGRGIDIVLAKRKATPTPSGQSQG